MNRSKKILIMTGIIVLAMLVIGFINYVINPNRIETIPSNVDKVEDSKEDLNTTEANFDDDKAQNNQDNIGVDIDDTIDKSIEIDKLEGNIRDNWVKVSIYDAKREDLTETVLVEPMTHGQYEYPLVADIPEVFADYTYSDNIGFGMIKFFYFDDGLTFEDHMVYSFDEIASGVYINAIKGKVIYKDEKFTITDANVTPPGSE